MIFQNYALFPHMSVRRNVGYGLEVKAMPKRERDLKVERMLETLGLADIADQRPDRLSGGQRQRIALARGLVVEPDILLLDEPLGALDANLRKTIQAELKLLQVNLGITFVFVTHAQSEALTLADRIVVMNAGRIEQVSGPRDLYTRPKTHFVAQFIGRNTILSGALERVDGRLGRVRTAFGGLRRRAERQRAGGRQGRDRGAGRSLYDCLPIGGGASSARCWPNSAAMRASRAATMVGPIIRFQLTGRGRPVRSRLEGHMEHYGEWLPGGVSQCACPGMPPRRRLIRDGRMTGAQLTSPAARPAADRCRPGGRHGRCRGRDADAHRSKGIADCPDQGRSSPPLHA